MATRRIKFDTGHDNYNNGVCFVVTEENVLHKVIEVGEKSISSEAPEVPSLRMQHDLMNSIRVETKYLIPGVELSAKYYSAKSRKDGIPRSGWELGKSVSFNYHKKLEEIPQVSMLKRDADAGHVTRICDTVRQILSEAAIFESALNKVLETSKSSVPYLTCEVVVVLQSIREEPNLYCGNNTESKNGETVVVNFSAFFFDPRQFDGKIGDS